MKKWGKRKKSCKDLEKQKMMIKKGVATLDYALQRCCEVITDGEELRNRYWFRRHGSIASLPREVKGMSFRDGRI